MILLTYQYRSGWCCTCLPRKKIFHIWELSDLEFSLVDLAEIKKLFLTQCLSLLVISTFAVSILPKLGFKSPLILKDETIFERPYFPTIAQTIDYPWAD